MKYRIIYIIDGMNMGGAERLLLQIILNLNTSLSLLEYAFSINVATTT